MVDLSLEILIGSIGALTGLISLVWHIINSRSKLVLTELYFKDGGYDVTQPRLKGVIGVRISLRNKGNKPTTIEKIMVNLDNYHMGYGEPIFKPFHMGPGSSKELKDDLIIDIKDHAKLRERYLSGERMSFGVRIDHTFGFIKKSLSGTPFNTGWLETIQK